MFSIEFENFYEVEKFIETETQEWLEDLMEVYREAGREFTTKARSKILTTKPYTNRTYDLVSSTGFFIAYNGDPVESYFPIEGPGSDGAKTGDDYAREIALIADLGEGVTLVLCAGMEYAEFVQAKGFDVVDRSFKWFEDALPRLLSS